MRELSYYSPDEKRQGSTILHPDSFKASNVYRLIKPIILVFLSVIICSTLLLIVVLSSRASTPFTQHAPPSLQILQEPISFTNASTVFNIIQSALRPKHSFIRPNGVSFIPAFIPQGTLLYHGTSSGSIEPGLEWVAMDHEFSYWFIADRSDPSNSRKPIDYRDQEEVYTIKGKGGGSYHPKRPNGRWNDHGSLFTLEVMKPLNKMILLDGASAAKLEDGQMDSQMILAGQKGDRTLNEREAAQLICEWGKPFGIDGYIRLEFAFEAVICDMKSDKLRIINNVSIPWKQELLGQREKDDTLFSEMDAVNGFDAMKSGLVHNKRDGRILLDYRGLVTAVNRTWVSPDPYVRRLINISQDIKDDLVHELEHFFHTVDNANPFLGTDWQLLTSEIVEKFAPILKVLNETYSRGYEHDEAYNYSMRNITLITSNFVRRFYVEGDRSEAERQAVYQYAHPLEPIQSKADLLIWSSITKVTQRVVNVLFDSFELGKKHWATLEKDELEYNRLQTRVYELLESLQWVEFYECNRKCSWDEVCYTPSWGPSPLGFQNKDLGHYVDDGRIRISPEQSCISYRNLVRT